MVYGARLKAEETSNTIHALSCFGLWANSYIHY